MYTSPYTVLLWRYEYQIKNLNPQLYWRALQMIYYLNRDLLFAVQPLQQRVWSCGRVFSDWFSVVWWWILITCSGVSSVQSLSLNLNVNEEDCDSEGDRTPRPEEVNSMKGGSGRKGTRIGQGSQGKKRSKATKYDAVDYIMDRIDSELYSMTGMEVSLVWLFQITSK